MGGSLSTRSQHQIEPTEKSVIKAAMATRWKEILMLENQQKRELKKREKFMRMKSESKINENKNNHEINQNASANNLNESVSSESDIKERTKLILPPVENKSTYFDLNTQIMERRKGAEQIKKNLAEVEKKKKKKAEMAQEETNKIDAILDKYEKQSIY